VADVVIGDTMSRHGLGVIHVLRAGAEPSRDEWRREVEEQRGGVVVEVLAWVDEAIRMHHLVVAWRLEMIQELMYCATIDGNLGQAVAQAAYGLMRRTGKLPNRAVVLNRENLPGEVLIRETEGAEPVCVKVVSVDKGMPKGMVGVYHEEEP
jgi:hypothetical protein